MPNGGLALLEFHRGELQRQRVGFGTLMIVVGPLLVAMLIFVFAAGLYAPRPSLTRGLPLLAGMAIWLVAAWFLSRRAERLRREKMAELDATRIEE